MEDEAIERRVAKVSDAFRRRFGRTADGVAEAPGRVNLIGEHLDYNGGLVLPMAIDRSVLVAYAARDDALARCYSLDYDEESSLALDAPIARDDTRSWSNYVRGVLDVLRGEGFATPGVDLTIAGNVPIGAGLSSSAALAVATLGALRAAWRLELDDLRVALLAQRAENDFVGVHCGVMDQLAATFGVRDHALLIDCRSLAHEPVPLRLEDQGVAIVVVDSGVRRQLEDSAYNARREECGEALDALRDAQPGRDLTSLCDVTLDDLAQHGPALPETLLRRARHVASEQRRVVSAVEALRGGDLESFGAMMNASHASLRDDFEVSAPELDCLVALAQGAAGVFGARLTGAGFGGCTVNLVRSEALASFRADVVERYAMQTKHEARMVVCRAADGLRMHRAST
ncbi:MAG: galactokinase [Dehalococcoidia bacterium]